MALRRLLLLLLLLLLAQVILWLGALLVWGQYRLAARQLTKRILILAGLEECAILACGLLLHVRTSRSAVWAWAWKHARLCVCCVSTCA